MSLAAAEALLDASGYAPKTIPVAMGQAARQLGFDYFCLVSSNVDQPAFMLPEEQGEGIGRYFNDGWLAVDYRARAERPLPLNTLFLDHRAVPDEERRRSEIYNELFVPWRMAYYAGMRFPLGVDEEWFCFVARSEEAGPIEGRDATRFRRIARAAMSAASLAVHTGATLARGVVTGLEAGSVAAVVLDQRGRVSAVTSAAESMFDLAFGIHDHRLWALDEGERHTLDSLGWHARNRSSQLLPRSFIIRAKGPGRAVQVDVSGVEGLGLDGLPGARLLLVFRDAGNAATLLARDLAEMYALTPAEADVAVLFGQGEGVSRIAAQRRVAEDTIRQQMKSIYRKTGVARQVDLIRLLERLRR